MKRLKVNNEPTANKIVAMIVTKPALDCSPVTGKAFVVASVCCDCALVLV